MGRHPKGGFSALIVAAVALTGIALGGTGAHARPAGKATLAAATAPQSTPLADPARCFEGPHGKTARKKGQICWLGALALEQTLPLGPPVYWCMTRIGHPVHWTYVEDSACDRQLGTVDVELAGYVRYDRADHAKSWPFNTAHLVMDHALEGDPVVVIHYMPYGKVSREATFHDCLNDGPAALAVNQQAHWGDCWNPNQDLSDRHTSFMVWTSVKPAGYLIPVHIVNIGSQEHNYNGAVVTGSDIVNGNLRVYFATMSPGSGDDALKWLWHWHPRSLGYLKK